MGPAGASRRQQAGWHRGRVASGQLPCTTATGSVGCSLAQGCAAGFVNTNNCSADTHPALNTHPLTHPPTHPPTQQHEGPQAQVHQRVHKVAVCRAHRAADDVRGTRDELGEAVHHDISPQPAAAWAAIDGREGKAGQGRTGQGVGWGGGDERWKAFLGTEWGATESKVDGGQGEAPPLLTGRCASSRRRCGHVQRA